MGGIEAAREIRQYESLRRIGSESYVDMDMKETEPPYSIDTVIIAMICASNPIDGDAIGRAGFSDFLVKPISLIHLERKIMEWGRVQVMIDYSYVFSEAVKRREARLKSKATADPPSVDSDEKFSQVLDPSVPEL